MILIAFILLMNIIFAAFRINMWTRAKERRYLVHRLCSRIKDDQPQGFAAFDWESILHGNAGELGDYKELAVLPDKIARYLYEFHGNFMQILMLCTAFLHSQWTEAIPMCMESSNLLRFYSNVL